MLTIKQITENTEEVIRGLEKKHFKDDKSNDRTSACIQMTKDVARRIN